MGRPLRIEYPGAFYHVMSRGNEQQRIFKSFADREKFQSYLTSAAERYGAALHAYCLMDNHYHLLLSTPDGNLAEIMRHINGAYTNYFNNKRQRAGHLLQGRYKALLVEQAAYALELSRYIHLNPVRAGMKARPEDHPWSSYRSFVGISSTPNWLDPSPCLACFAGERGKYRRFVEEALGKEIPNPLVAAIGGTILGTPAFIQAIEEKQLGKTKAHRDIPGIGKISSRWSVETILAEVTKVIPDDERLRKKMAIYLCHRYSGARLREIGACFSVGESAVSQESRRFKRALDEDGNLRDVLEQVRARLRNVNV